MFVHVASLDDLFELPIAELRKVLGKLTPDELAALNLALDDQTDDTNPYLKYRGDISRIITEEWGEVLWSKQREILESFQNNVRTCVVTTPGIGKSDLVSQIVCASVAAALHDPHQIRIITTAAQFRLVKTIMWPYIKRVAADHKIPGWNTKYKPSRIGSTEWYVNDTMVADGVAAADNDETAMRGIHSLGRVVVVVDEASGISKKIGRVLNGLLTAENDRMIVLGNPPTDDTDTWFEEFANQAIVNTIHIPYTETPNFTEEITGICNRCGPRVETHTISKHLTSKRIIADIRAQYPDENDPYVQAFLYARFPQGNTAKAIPMVFLEKALPVYVEVTDAFGAKVFNDDGTPKKVPDPEWLAKSQRTGRIRFGLDVASDGGDEVVLAKRTHMHGKIVFHRTGPENENSNRVAEAIIPFIEAAVQEHEEWGIKETVMVNVDRTGVGVGVYSALVDWVNLNKLNRKVEVVGVMVGEAAQRKERFTAKRSEIWWTMREWLQADDCEVTLEDDRGLDKLSVVKQLNGPTYRTNTQGRTQIETKAEMKKRGARSPDRADAMMLAFYEDNTRRRTITPGIFPELKKANEWAVPSAS